MPPLTLFLTGETRGNLSPCKCPTEAWGGLARRVGFLERAHLRHPDALFLDAGGFLPVGDVPLRDDPAAGQRLTTLLLNSLLATRVAAVPVEIDALRFLEHISPVETQSLPLLRVHPAVKVRQMDWGPHRVALFPVDRRWSDEEIESIAARAKTKGDVTIALARANGVSGPRLAELSGADIIVLSLGARPDEPLRVGNSWLVGAGKLGKEVLEMQLRRSAGDWEVSRYVHHPMDESVPGAPAFEAATEQLLREFGPGWDFVVSDVTP